MTVIGTFNGELLALHIPRRVATDARVPSPTLWLGNRKAVIDTTHMPTKAARSLPMPLINTSVADWHPFIAQAFLHGLWRS